MKLQKPYQKILDHLQDSPSSVDRFNVQDLVTGFYNKMVNSLLVKGASMDLATDVVQEFVLKKLMDREFLEKVDLRRGGLEPFLLSCLYRFFIDQVRHQKREKDSIKRFAAENLNSIEFQNDSTGKFLSRQWALSIFGRAISRLKTELLENDKEIQWKLFTLKYIRPMKDGKRNRVVIPLAKLTDQLGIRSIKRIEYLWKKTRERFVQTLKEELKNLHGDLQDELDEKFQRLKQILIEPEAWLEDWKEVLPEDCHRTEEDLPRERWSTCGEQPVGIDVRELLDGHCPTMPITQQETAHIWETVRHQPFDQFLKDYLPQLVDNFSSTALGKYVVCSKITLDELDLIRKASKSGMQCGEFPYMAPIFHMLYAVAIAKSFVDFRSKISRMSNKDIVGTLQYAQQQSWIPDSIQRVIELGIRKFIAEQ